MLGSRVQYTGHAQAILWKGEDYVRVSGLRASFLVALKQITRAVLAREDECEECAICLEPLAGTAMGAVTALYSFACGHMLCPKCAQLALECPVCRETKPFRRGMEKKKLD